MGLLRTIVGASLVLWVVVGLPAASATPEARSTDDSCPAEVPDAGFDDVSGDNVHEPAIDCVSWHDIARGTSPQRYSPTRHVTRGQMATFIVRTMAVAGYELPPASRDYFQDDDGSTHEDAIDRLAEAGVVLGTGDGRYRPADAVDRAQMGSYLRRAHDYPSGAAMESSGDHFDDDDGSPHEASINAIASAGIAVGTAPRIYEPAVAVRRDQIATFLARFLDALIERQSSGGDERGLVPALPDAPATAYQLNPQHTGAVGVAADPTQSLSIAWAVDLGGDLSYPIIADGTVFVIADQRGGGYGTTLYALDAAAGTIRWRSELGGTYYWAAHTYADGRVFTINYDGVMQAFAAASGEQLWVNDLPQQWSFTSPPTAYAGSIFVGGAGLGGTIYAVDASSGDVRWTNEVSNGDHSSPAVNDDGVYVSYACNQSYAFGPADGQLVWHHDSPCSGGGGRTVVVHDGRVYTRDSNANLVLDAATGDEIGVHPGLFAPAFLGDTGYAVDGRGELVAFDVATGQEQWRTPAEGRFTTAPIVAAGAVYAGTELGELYAFDASSGEVLWSDAGAAIPAPDEHNVSSPLTGLAVGQGVLIVPTEDRLVAYR